jgi:hypothetical protein
MEDKANSLKDLVQKIELEKTDMKKYIAKSELMVSTLRSVIEMYRLTGMNESQRANLDKKLKATA